MRSYNTWCLIWTAAYDIYPDSKVYGANMGPICGRQDPGGPLVGQMNFTIWVAVAFRIVNNHITKLYISSCPNYNVAQVNLSCYIVSWLLVYQFMHPTLQCCTSKRIRLHGLKSSCLISVYDVCLWDNFVCNYWMNNSQLCVSASPWYLKIHVTVSY